MFKRLKRKIRRAQIGFKLLHSAKKLRGLALDKSIDDIRLRKTVTAIAEQQLSLSQELYDLLIADHDFTGALMVKRNCAQIEFWVRSFEN